MEKIPKNMEFVIGCNGKRNERESSELDLIWVNFGAN